MHTTRWHIENKAVLIKLKGDVKLSDLTILNAQIIKDYLDPLDNPIHLIVDASDVTKLPTDLLGIVKTSQPLSDHRNLGLSIYYRFLGHKIGIIANAAAMFVNNPYRMVQSIEEADRFIRVWEEERATQK